jgi:hypothetical protein
MEKSYYSLQEFLEHSTDPWNVTSVNAVIFLLFVFFINLKLCCNVICRLVKSANIFV